MKVILDIELSFVRDVSLVDKKSGESKVDDLYDNMLASEPVLSIDWLKKEENDVWANL